MNEDYPQELLDDSFDDLNQDFKDRITSYTYEQLLSAWRFEPIASAIFHGRKGLFYRKTMGEKRREDPEDAVRAFKAIGWDL